MTIDNFPVGSIIHSMLTELQFQQLAGDKWVLADGRSITGSIYASVTGTTNLPDMRGRFLRGKGNGSGNNPDGELALGTYTADKLGSHTHGLYYYITTADSGSNANFVSPGVSGNTSQSQSSGGNETAPKSITVNIFIKIN